MPPTAPRYFELGDRFWEIALGETTITTRQGNVGSPCQTETTQYGAYYEATRESRRLVSEMTKAGYVEKVGQPPAPKSNAALEKAILANPFDDAAYMVYADWLQDQGDPRGELIALQAGGKDEAANKFLDEHADYFLGPLKAHQKCHDGFHDKKHAPAFTWKNGFISAARLAHNQHADNWKGRLATDVLLPLLLHPSGKFLVELTLNENDDPSEDTLDALFDVIAIHPMPALRKLRIGDEVSQISWYRVGNLGRIWSSVPNLTDFEIEAGQFELGTIELPNLVRAVFQTGGLSKTAAQSIAQARWPKLEHLEVYFGDPDYECTATLEDALAILDGTNCSKLRYLGLKNAEFQADLVPHLAASKLVRQLHTLDMSCGILLDEHVDSILQNADAFKHLEVLDVGSTWLTPNAVERLQGVAKKVICEGSWNDANPEFRYVRIGE